MLNTAELEYDVSSRASSSSTMTGTRCVKRIDGGARGADPSLAAPQDRSCTTGSDTGTVRSSEIFRLERQVDEERTRRLAIADELSVLKAQLTRACGTGTPS